MIGLVNFTASMRFHAKTFKILRDLDPYNAKDVPLTLN